MTRLVSNLKITVPSQKELKEYLDDLLESHGYEEGEFTDDTILEFREILLDYIMDNLEVEVV